ncbi:MAG TPA: phage/plasmid primase, P4 family [Pyrinomonadaceae bacterium]|jgi:putative DNA primase/helicase|nr:phage/plasmid primase, P4 family [Pyrinomonadaceae bacterium]
MPSSPKLDLRQIRLRDRYLADYPNTIYGLGEWRRYDNGVWPVVHELLIRREIQESVMGQRQVAIKVDNALINSLYNLIKAHRFISDSQFDRDKGLLIFDDCTLDFLTGERRGHLPENYRTSKLPFAYDPDATSDCWLKFLFEVVGEEVANFLQEFAGYAITGLTKYEIAVWLYGPPGGGKSTFITGLESMLGAQCGVLGLSDIETSNFGLTNLPGKTLVISTEQPAHFIKSAHIVNALISGERVTVDRKFRDPVTFASQCKILWAMNELPRVDDKGAGIFRRVKLVHFPSIDENKRDPRVKEEIQVSGMAILNWARIGLQRLLQRGRFQIPDVVQAATEHYRINNDIPRMFVEERCEADSTGKIQAQTLYEMYREWCSDTGHKPLASPRFSEEMQRLGFHKVKIGNVYYRGLKLRA